MLKTFYHSSHYHFSILGENNKPDIFLIMNVMHTYMGIPVADSC